MTADNRPTASDEALAEMLAAASERLDAAANIVSAIQRELARRATSTPTTADEGPRTCRGCDTELTGRQRQWCSEACRHRADRARARSPSVPERLR